MQHMDKMDKEMASIVGMTFQPHAFYPDSGLLQYRCNSCQAVGELASIEHAPDCLFAKLYADHHRIRQQIAARLAPGPPLNLQLSKHVIQYGYERKDTARSE
jgi:hypothetical protein